MKVENREDKSSSGPGLLQTFQQILSHLSLERASHVCALFSNFLNNKLFHIITFFVSFVCKDILYMYSVNSSF